MNAEEYKTIIEQMFRQLNESDSLFLKQIYTLIKRHLERKGKC